MSPKKPAKPICDDFLNDFVVPPIARLLSPVTDLLKKSPLSRGNLEPKFQEKQPGRADVRRLAGRRCCGHRVLSRLWGKQLEPLDGILFGLCSFSQHIALLSLRSLLLVATAIQEALSFLLCHSIILCHPFESS